MIDTRAATIRMRLVRGSTCCWEPGELWIRDYLGDSYRPAWSCGKGEVVIFVHEKYFHHTIHTKPEVRVVLWPEVYLTDAYYDTFNSPHYQQEKFGITEENQQHYLGIWKKWKKLPNGHYRIYFSGGDSGLADSVYDFLVPTADYEKRSWKYNFYWQPKVSFQNESKKVTLGETHIEAALLRKYAGEGYTRIGFYHVDRNFPAPGTKRWSQLPTGHTQGVFGWIPPPPYGEYIVPRGTFLESGTTYQWGGSTYFYYDVPPSTQYWEDYVPDDPPGGSLPVPSGEPWNFCVSL
jgi:hypothetical protein